MKVKDPHFVLEKIRKYINEDIVPTRYREYVEIENWKYMETSMDENINDAYPVDYDDSSWADFRLWNTWGGYDKCAWFRTNIEIPENFREKQIALRFLVGPRDGGESTAETLLYIDGKPVQGIDIWHEEALLDEEQCKKDHFCIALKAWSGVLVPPKFRTFKLAQLILLDKKVDKFCFVIDTVLRCTSLLDENDLRRIRLTRLLDDTFKKVNFLEMRSEEYYQSIYDALDYIQEELEKLAQVEEIKPEVYGVGHSHIDMAWLWRLNATREKASRTFSTVLNLMKQYPEYKYMHSSPQLYKFLEEDYPEIFEQVKEKIKEGQWEITGGMWVEPDTNIPSGESLVRQFLYGKKYIREEFGKETYLTWLPDVFGYSAAFPQIMKKSGMKYFMTTKISWNQYNYFPHDTFWWKGIDGSEMFTHFITTPEDGSWYYTYNGHMDPEEVTGVWKNYKDKDKNDKLLIAYGWGDGGGGPTREMIEQSKVMKNIPGIPKVKMSGAEEYFEKLYDNADRDSLETWEGELYFEMHRGTYTSQAANKKYNRKTEILLHNIESIAVEADLRNRENKYPKEELDKIWERTLLNQFHDILPGSSIRQVYEDTTKDYEKISQKGNVLLDEASERAFATVGCEKDSVLVRNTSGFARNSYVTIPYSNLVRTGMGIKEDGQWCSVQDTKEGILAYVKDIPPYGYKMLELASCAKGQEVVEKELDLSPAGGYNRYYDLKLNKNGEIIYLYDKENKKEISTGQPMNRFVAYEDKPQRFDAWDVDVYYKEKPYAPFVLKSSKVVEQNQERCVLRQIWQFHNSEVCQDLILYRQSRRIDFKTTVDWKEKQVFFKTYFPVAVHAQEATYEIQFGSIKRPTHTNTEWDFARFEVPGHRYADLSEGNYGVSVLNDCKYGWDIHGNTIGLSLIKSAVRPDESADRKVHTFTYSLYPHTGNVETCDALREAVNLNMPMLVSEQKGISGAKNTEKTFSFVQTDSNHVLIDTVKKAEDGDAYVVRLYEYRNISEDTVTIRFAYPVKKIVETNLCEEEEKEIPAGEQKVTIPISCFEIKTLKVYWK